MPRSMMQSHCMTQRTVVTLEDDLTGEEADETVSFAIDGKAYEIDLSESNATVLREALAPYVGVARRSGRVAVPAARRGAPLRHVATEVDNPISFWVCAAFACVGFLFTLLPPAEVLWLVSKRLIFP